MCSFYVIEWRSETDTIMDQSFVSLEEQNLASYIEHRRKCHKTAVSAVAYTVRDVKVFQFAPGSTEIVEIDYQQELPFNVY
jgi:hypothetical protein